MIYAIISDIHANPDALQRVLTDARGCGAEKTICLGDIVGYGPLPREALRMLRSIDAIILAGNHDDAVSGRLDASTFIDLAGDAVIRHREQLAKDDLAFLAALPYTAQLPDAACAHGDFTDPAAFNYVDSDESAAANFAATPENLLFIGHTHVPELRLIGASGQVHTLPPQDFVVEEGKRYIVNVGSVGYPREANGQCLSSYVLYDVENHTVHYRFLPFAVASLLQRGRSPHSHNRKRLLLISVIGALIAALGIFAIVRPTETPISEPPSAISENSLAKDPPLAERSLVLTPFTRAVHANLRLHRKSAPAHLTIDFVDSAGRTLAPLALVVPYSSQKALPVPADAARAFFRVRAANPGASPQIIRFDPTAD